MVAAALFFLAVAAAMTLALPLAVRRMIDHGFSNSDPTFIANYFSMLVVIAGVLALASACRYYYVITLGERVVADIRNAVFAHVTHLSPGFFDTAQSGEIVSRLTADTTQIKSAVGATASMALRNVIMGLGAVALMVVTSPKLSGLVIAAIPLIVLPLVAFGRSVRRKSRMAQDTLAAATAYASEQIGAVRTLQAFTNERLVTGRFSRAVEASFAAAKSSVFARAILTFVAIFAIFTSVVAVLWFGSRDVLSGVMTAGTLSQFLIYAVIAAGALGALSEVWGDLSQAAGASERIAELLAEKPAVAAPAVPTRLPKTRIGSVAFDDVGFAYPARPDRPSLHGVSFATRPGETLAIVGPSGAGKSTIFSLILRFYDPLLGSISVDGVDLREADPEEVRARIAIVPQDVTIFAATARDNIGFGRPGASDAEIESAAIAAHADEFIQRLAEGLRDRARRARRDAVGRPAPAHRHCPRHPARCADPAARRGDVGARRRKRDAGADRARSTDAGTHDAGHRAPAGDGAQGGPHPGHGSGTHRRGRHAPGPCAPERHLRAAGQAAVRDRRRCFQGRGGVGSAAESSADACNIRLASRSWQTYLEQQYADVFKWRGSR